MFFKVITAGDQLIPLHTQLLHLDKDKINPVIGKLKLEKQKLNMEKNKLALEIWKLKYEMSLHGIDVEIPVLDE